MNRRKAKTSWTLRISVVLGILALAVWQSGGRHISPLLAAFPVAPAAESVAYPAAVTAPADAVLPVPAARSGRESVLLFRTTRVYNQKVRLHLFASRPPKFISISSDDGLMVSGHPAEAKITVSINGTHVLVRTHSRKVADAPAVTIEPIENILQIRQPNGRLLRTPGELRISVRQGRLHIVNQLDLESYLMGIVEPELGSLKLPAEAIKAQLVASRSYILAVRDRHPHEDFDFCDDPHCQVYAGIPASRTGSARFPPRYEQAAAAVRGVYLRYHGMPAAAFFHHSCGGCTEAIEDVWGGSRVGYLRRVKDSDQEYLGTKGWEWSFTISRKSFMKLAYTKRWIQGPQALDGLRVIRTDLSGRASQILVQSAQPKWVPARAFLQIMNRQYGREVLPSLLFHITMSGDNIRFDGRGWGHGVGMCQAGSVLLARQGHTYQQILQHYYPGTTLVRLKPNAKLPKADSRRMRFLPWTD